ncbi:uncharacterized protein J3D65DRAFT_214923 [Phyllosticta citribraziliensis]|uniref:Uncharacterized protein n=1 Tax=Phyllosticta citribraziliensis TaxID=989973 RepID=A0ABR1M4B1_9PEZI
MARQTESPAANDKSTSRDAVRIPRLTYRNRLPQDSTDTIEPVSKPALDAQPVFPGNERRADPAQRQVSAATSLESSLVGGPARPSSATTPGKTNQPTSADAFAQRRSDSIAVDKKAKKTKLRGISLLGFLAVKEPSANALEHFARQEQRRAEAKGSISVASMSHQKMPEGVPRVNTKWDGLPEAVKTRPGTSTDRQSTARSFSSSRLSTATEDSKRSKSTTSTTSTIDFALSTPSVEEISPRPVNLSSARQDSGTGSEAMRSRTGGLTSGAVRFAQPHPSINEVAPWAEPPL